MKKCKFCGKDIPKLARRCRHCGQWLSQEFAQKLDLSSIMFPDILPGLLLSLCLLFLTVNEDLVLSFSFKLYVFWKIVLIIGGYIFFLMIVNKIHQILFQITDNHYPITPQISVIYSLVPLYNLYWIFKWPAELIMYLNKRDGKKRLPPLFPGFIFILCSFAGVERALFMHFLILYYFVLLIKNSITPEPIVVQYKTNTPSKIPPVICVVMSLLVPILILLFFPLENNKKPEEPNPITAVKSPKKPAHIFLTNKKDL